MDRFTYYRMGLKELETIKKEGLKPTLLLHSCCAPCNSYPVELLSQYFDLTLYFNNSNIYPEEEFERRLEELKNYINYFNIANKCNIQIIVPPYDENNYRKNLTYLKDEKEGGKRCKYCYATRMKEAYDFASKNNFDYFTTVMTISRQKSSIILNEIGIKLSKLFPKTKYLISDFKKGGGIDKGLEIAKMHNMYRQDYCGCYYSYLNEENKKKNKSD